MLAWHEVVGVAILVAELPHVVRRRSDRTRDRGADRSSLRVVWIAIACGVTGAFVTCSRAIGPRYELTSLVLTIAMGIAVAGFVLRAWAVATLGRLFTVDVAIREGHALVKAGPFAFARHPSYTGLIAMFVGWAITFGGIVPAIVLLAPTIGALTYRMNVEEAALSSAFGAEYDAYRASTKRLVPFVY